MLSSLSSRTNKLKLNKPPNKRNSIIFALVFALIGVIALVSSFAATNADTKVVEAESASLSGNIAIKTDNRASESRFVEFGQDPSSSSTRGPDGTKWPSHTPSYTTPATTYISTLFELNDALKVANSGDVIEVAPHTFNTSTEYKIIEGNASWEKNVLVRPPIGQRQSIIVDSSFTLNAPHVTIAGLKANNTITLFDKADRSAWARIELGQQGFLRNRNSASGEFLEDAGIYEIVAFTPKLRNDRMQISGVSSGGVRRFTIDGVWLRGSYRPVGGADHSDTLQFFVSGGGIWPKDITIKNSVFFASANAALQVPNNGGNLLLDNVFSASCSYMNDIPSGYECNGSHNINLGGSLDLLSIKNSDMFGNITLRGLTLELENTNATNIPIGGTYGGTIVDLGGNFIDSSVSSQYTEPAEPNLDAIWD